MKWRRERKGEEMIVKYGELGLLICLFKSDEWEWERRRRCEKDRGRDGERVKRNYKKSTISSLSREKEWLGGRMMERERNKEEREKQAIVIHISNHDSLFYLIFFIPSILFFTLFLISTSHFSFLLNVMKKSDYYFN